MLPRRTAFPLSITVVVTVRAPGSVVRMKTVSQTGRDNWHGTVGHCGYLLDLLHLVSIVVKYTLHGLY